MAECENAGVVVYHGLRPNFLFRRRFRRRSSVGLVYRLVFSVGSAFELFLAQFLIFHETGARFLT